MAASTFQQQEVARSPFLRQSPLVNVISGKKESRQGKGGARFACLSLSGRLKSSLEHAFAAWGSGVAVLPRHTHRYLLNQQLSLHLLLWSPSPLTLNKLKINLCAFLVGFYSELGIVDYKWKEVSRALPVIGTPFK